MMVPFEAQNDTPWFLTVYEMSMVSPGSASVGALAVWMNKSGPETVIG
jgi:hypothetical protein